MIQVRGVPRSFRERLSMISRWHRLLLLVCALIPATGAAQISSDRLLHSSGESQNWLMYSGDYASQRHSSLRQIGPANVQDLELKWVFQAQSLQKFEATPLVADGVMYVTQAPDDVLALDPKTGRAFWVYHYNPAPDARPCCGRVNRGVAILGDTLFLATIDAHLVAIDARNGHPVWNIKVAEASSGYALTLAPLVIKDKVVLGVAGVNFFDNCWEYHDGLSEERLGAALKGKRDQVILMTKVCTHGRKKDIAMQMLEESLRRLKTDHLDVWQIHEVIYENDPDLIFAPGGAAEALLEAKQQGKVRFIGFTGHKNPSIHLKMLSHDFPFDTVQMPLNCFDATFRSFETHVLPEANRRGLAVFGMKSLGGSGEMVHKGGVTPKEGLSYAMSLPVATTISGIESGEVLDQNLGIARGFKPLNESAMKTLRERCQRLAGDGRLELFKTTTKYDGAVGRQQHHYPTTDELPA
jgi:diketogulonate reductase-like aldo/keto reductase